MTFTPAQFIHSPQDGVHSSLEKILHKYSTSEFKKPIAEHTQQAFDEAYNYYKTGNFDSVFLDSACGTAESTRYLAQQHPNILVVGLDQSAKRLSHSDNHLLPENCLVLRCDCTDFWRLAEQNQWRFQFHSLYYPNPYPKLDGLKKRWHGHPAFLSLVNISEHIELRTNWKIYAEEFHFALQVLGRSVDGLERYQCEESITAFERKYQKSGHELWRVFSR